MPTEQSPPTSLFMVFDVESIGLHGEGFAVGWVVVNEDGSHVASAAYTCDPDLAHGDDEHRAWVAEHVPWQGISRESSARWVRDRFWEAWLYARKRGAVLVADCAWPVEARFLIACVEDAPEARGWEGPYPLHELASFMVAAGMDPLATCERLPDEPEHHPLGDAKQSARLLVSALARLRGACREPATVGGA
jgi:hypothetical protein